jgi:putative sigma-54 modulation protein
MELQVRGRNVPITDALQVHAEKRMHKIERVLGPFADKAQVEVELAVEHNPSIAKGQIAEVTVRTKGPVIRVREADSDMYAAIDLAAHRVERAAQRLRERHKDHHGPGIQAVAATPAEIAALDRLGKDATDAVESPPPIRIVRSKRFEMPSLTPEDAAVRLELIDHEFFVFRNEASGEVSVIYRRRDGDFGLIEGA